MSLFVSSTASACIYALLPEEFFGVFRRIEEAPDAALIVASVSASLALGYRMMGKNTGKNKDVLEGIPKFFNNDDKIDFDAANAKTSSEHTKLNSARKEATSVTRDWILLTPARLGKGKKRIIDNVSYTHNLDAPVAPQVAMHILLQMAAPLHWFISIFGVSSEFAGNNHERKRYFSPPREGTPPKATHEVKKRLFSLREAPRLGWLRAMSVIMAAGFEEIESCPAVFVLFDKLRFSGKRAMIGMLILHVGDGLWAGFGPLYAAAKDKIRKEFNVHERNSTF